MMELIEACRKAGPLPEAAVMIDGDPKPYKEVRWPDNWAIHVAKEHMEMIGASNELMRLHPDKPWYGFLNDRSRPVTSFWWQRLVEECSGGWANCKSWGHNPRTGLIRMVDGVYDGRVVKALGWCFPPFLVHFFGDDILEEVLQRNGLWRETDVEMKWVSVPKFPRVFRGRPYWESDKNAYIAWKKSFGFEQITERLRNAGLI